MNKITELLKEYKIKFHLSQDLFNQNKNIISFDSASDWRINLYGEIEDEQFSLIFDNNGKIETYFNIHINSFDVSHINIIIDKIAYVKDIIDASEKCIWSKGDFSIEYKNGSMQYFRENQLAKNYDNVMYFYYDMVIKVKSKNGRKKTYVFSTHDEPKVQYLSFYIDNIVNFDIKNKGYLLEDYKDVLYKENGVEKYFHRKIFYHQIEAIDFGCREYFIRFERYDYEVKQAQEDNYNYWTKYNMTIGEMPYASTSEACESIFITDLTEEDLQRLKQVAQRFVSKTIEDENEYISSISNA